MAHKGLLLPHVFLFLAIATVISVAPSQAKATESTLYSFDALRNGSVPQGGLIADAADNLYGTTAAGGEYGFGTIFELTPNQHGGWDKQILHSFKSGSDGAYPVAGLTFDAMGNLYGTTYWGGTAGGCLVGGCGTVFELRHNPDGSWTESILQDFDNGARGGDLEGELVFDQAGNLYGTGIAGGAHSGGVVFELSPSSGGKWTETVLHSFDYTKDGETPAGRLVIDQAGILFGVATYGSNGCNASGGCGMVYELSPGSGGQWTETILHNFTAGSDGAFPEGGLVSDQAGNLYGTTDDGGTGTGVGCNFGCGTVFELTRGGNGQWTETILYNFQGTSDGSDPESELVFDSAGNLYGTTYDGGGLGTCTDGGCGTAFELTPHGTGQWTEKVLWRFSGITDGANPSSGLLLNAAGQLVGETFLGADSGEHGTVFALTPSGDSSWSLSALSNFADTDGDYPTAGLIADASGNLYGTTAGGGARGLGAVFELTPAAGGGWKENVIYSFQTGLLQYLRGIQSGTFPSTLTLDAAGNLYGETETGSEYHAGTVYELSPASGGGWTEQILYTFKDGAYGNNPTGGLVMDPAGNLYGTTVYGGEGSTQGKLLSGKGVVFELSPGENGKWSQKVIYRFGGYPSDGSHPQAGVILDQAGNLYGTTFQGGGGSCQDEGFGTAVGCGTVFELSPKAAAWSESVLYAFTSFQSDGALPSGGLVFDQAGNLFGTTQHGSGGLGCDSCGTVFELSRAAGGGWTESLAFVFPDPDSGVAPVGGLIVDQAGNLYGTTSNKVSGCNGYACGTVFKLSPTSGGGWSASALYSFTDGSDGGSPMSGLIFGSGGSLYGTTVNGGAAGEGVVFAITP
jgi:uncharacterized repeat protein (TIGR03803 family)